MKGITGVEEVFIPDGEVSGFDVPAVADDPAAGGADPFLLFVLGFPAALVVEDLEVAPALPAFFLPVPLVESKNVRRSERGFLRGFQSLETAVIFKRGRSTHPISSVPRGRSGGGPTCGGEVTIGRCGTKSPSSEARIDARSTFGAFLLLDLPSPPCAIDKEVT